jgi:tetratricopeptide (TPR) repeat protein
MRIMILLILTAFVVGCGNRKSIEEKSRSRVSGKPLKSKEQYHKEFLLSMQKGDTAEAIKVLQRFQKTDSADVESEAALIVLQVHTGEMSDGEGRSKLQKIFDNSPTPGVDRLYLSFILNKAINEKAITKLDSLIAQYPTRGVFHTSRAYMLMNMERFDGAIESFTNAMKYDSNNLYLRADRSLALYKKGDKKMACMAWKIPGGGSQSYYEQYCKWEEFETAWNEFVRAPGQQTANEVETMLSKHHDYMTPPEEKFSKHILTSWSKLSHNTPGNETLLSIGFQLLKMMKDERNYELRCELAKSITSAPKIFLEEVRSNRHRFEDLNEIVGAFGKEVMNDKASQLKEVERRIISLNSVNATDLIKTRGECLLALEKKRERLMRP